MQPRITHRRIVVLLLLVVANSFPRLTFSFDFSLSTLTPIEPTRYDELRNLDPLILDGARRESVFSVPPFMYRTWVEQALKQGQTALEFYFDSSWRSLDSNVLVIDHEALSAVNQKFELASLFPQSGVLRKTLHFDGGMLEAGKPFEKQAIVLTPHRVVTIYPHPVAIAQKHYIIKQGNSYDFYRINILERDPLTPYPEIVIKRLVGRNHPSEILNPIRGPMGVRLLAVRCLQPCREMEIKTALLTVHKQAIQISRK